MVLSIGFHKENESDLLHLLTFYEEDRLPLCTGCYIPLTVEHVMIECRTYE